MKPKTLTLSLGSSDTRLIMISIKEDSCCFSISNKEDNALMHTSITLTPEEAEEIGSFINKEIFTQSLEA